MKRAWNHKLVGAILCSLILTVSAAEASEPTIDMSAVTEMTVIQEMNELVRANCPSIVDIAAIADEEDGQWVREYITLNNLPPTDLYRRGKLITAEDRQRLLDNMNLDPIGKTQEVGYGVAVRRANVRSMPMGGGLFLSADDMEHDILQVGALDPCETVRLLHVSKDRRYYFVQSQSMYGWVFVGDIAVAKKSDWMSYHAPTEFVTVIARGERIKHDGETVYAQMGTKLPLVSEKENEYKVKLPMRGNHGKLVDVETMLEKSDSYIIGHLDYGATEIASLIDAYVGAPYGYHGLKNSEDNDGMIGDIYRAMGIVLPREAGELACAAYQLPPCGDVSVVPTEEGNVLMIERDGQVTVIGMSADGKTIGAYPLSEDKQP